MSIASEIQRIKTAKENITRALRRKGIQIPEGSTLNDFAEVIDPITSGEELSWEDNPDGYLSFKFVKDGKFYWKTNSPSWTKTIQYSLDVGSTWTSVAATADGYVCDVEKGDEVWVKGTETAYANSNNYCYFYNTGFTYVSGNVNSLINFGSLSDYCFKNLFSNNININIEVSHPLTLPTTTLADYCYYAMFYGCTSLTTAPALPATTLANGCYYGMFQSCTNLAAAPELSATTLVGSCYSNMFYGCTNLTTIPVLPATTLAGSCYRYMFQNCTNLTTIPVLPATTLADYCYSSMFSGCTSITTAPELPATTLTSNCYSNMFAGCTSLTTPPQLPATTLAIFCYSSMFSGCTNLTSAPELPATTLANRCYDSMFYGCTCLTTAPELPATTLIGSCYYRMFYNCASLNYIECMATDISEYGCTRQWVNNVASTGTFVKDANMTSWTTGYDGIPSGWTVQDAA